MAWIVKYSPKGWKFIDTIQFFDFTKAREEMKKSSMQMQNPGR